MPRGFVRNRQRHRQVPQSADIPRAARRPRRGPGGDHSPGPSAPGSAAARCHGHGHGAASALAAVRGFRKVSRAPLCIASGLSGSERHLPRVLQTAQPRVRLDSSNESTDPVAGHNRYSIMADDSGNRGMRAQHVNGMTTEESKLVISRIPIPSSAGWTGTGTAARQRSRSSPGLGPRPAGLPGLRAQARVWRQRCGITAAGCLIDPLQPGRGVGPSGTVRVPSGTRGGRPAMAPERRQTHRAPAFRAPAPPQPVAGRTVQRSGLRPVLPAKGRCIPERNSAGKPQRGLPQNANLQQPPRERGSVGVLPATPQGQPGAMRQLRPAGSGNHREFFAGTVPQYHCRNTSAGTTPKGSRQSLRV